MKLKYNYKDLKLPEHIGIIMDGNGRWAKERGKKRTFGHKQGAKTLKETTKLLYEIGVGELTVYAFSTENWKRPKEEVDYLMSLLKRYLKESIKTAKENNMLVRIIGDRSVFETDTIRMIDELEQVSAEFTGMKLNIAVNYGGRDEIVRAVNRYFLGDNTIDKKITNIAIIDSDNTGEKEINTETVESYNKSKKIDELVSADLDFLRKKSYIEETFIDFLDKEPITEDIISSLLDTKASLDPELIIRTSGEQRTSNFLIWQSAYSEFYFTKTLWPDFGEDDLYAAISFFNKTERRFGGVK